MQPCRRNDILRYPAADQRLIGPAPRLERVAAPLCAEPAGSRHAIARRCLAAQAGELSVDAVEELHLKCRDPDRPGPSDAWMGSAVRHDVSRPCRPEAGTSDVEKTAPDHQLVEQAHGQTGAIGPVQAHDPTR